MGWIILGIGVLMIFIGIGFIDTRQHAESVVKYNKRENELRDKIYACLEGDDTKYVSLVGDLINDGNLLLLIMIAEYLDLE